jgi:outer membrane protein, multidrug efflux system
MKMIGTILPLILSGCAVGPDYEAPRPEVPGTWNSLETPKAGQASAAKAVESDLSAWWTAFGDPALVRLVEQGLAGSLDLRGAASRVREARALRGVARGALLPEAGAGGGHERVRPSEKGFFPSDGEPFNHYQAGFDASWEIDVFGGNRRRLEAAVAEVEASEEAFRDVRVSLVAEVARNYVEFRSAQARGRIARLNLEAQQKTAQVIRARLDAGQATELDVSRAEAQVSVTASMIPLLETLERRSVHAIALLLGKTPGLGTAELSATAPIPSAPAVIPVGLPTDLLRRRPDLRRAERELAAATARIGVATAGLYPRFFLSGSLGSESVNASDFLTPASRAWSFGPSISWSLFQGGRIRANIEVQNARQEQAAIRFEQTLLGALRDVEDALVAHSREQIRKVDLTRAVGLQRRAVDLAQERYLQGLADFLVVLEAQRLLYAAEDAVVRTEESVATNAVALFKAVGGGWKPEERP